MKYGIYLPNYGIFGDPNTLVEIATTAEQAGWDGFFIWDHISRPKASGPVADPWITLAAAAAKTERIMLGAMVTPLPRRRPWKVAKEAASLQAISKGRLIFGAGIGGGRSFEWADFGEEADARVRGRMLDEGLDVLRQLWKGEPVTHSGEFYQLKNALISPAPEPEIPIWIGGYYPSKAPLRRAAQQDGGFILFHDQHGPVEEQFPAMAAELKPRRTAEVSFDIVYRNDHFAPGEHERGLEMANTNGITWWLEQFSQAPVGRNWQQVLSLDDLLKRVELGPGG